MQCIYNWRGMMSKLYVFVGSNIKITNRAVEVWRLRKIVDLKIFKNWSLDKDFECAYYAMKMSLVYEKTQIDLRRGIEIAIIVYESGCIAHFRFLDQWLGDDEFCFQSRIWSHQIRWPLDQWTQVVLHRLFSEHLYWRKQRKCNC